MAVSELYLEENFVSLKTKHSVYLSIIIVNSGAPISFPENEEKQNGTLKMATMTAAPGP